MTIENCKIWTVTLEETDDGSGDLVLPLPQDMLDEFGWNTGDNLKWIERDDGTWEIRKVEE
jgi:hypothetical protein